MALEIAVYHPEQVVANDAFESCGLTAESIFGKLGVERRYVAGRNETVLGMAVKAIRLLKSVLSPEMIIFSTSYPDGVNNASELVKYPGFMVDGCMNIHAACSGFTYSLTYIHKHQDRFEGQPILLLASEKYSPTLVNLRNGGNDPSLSQTIFSDGAAAMIFTNGVDLKILSTAKFSFPKDKSGCLKMPICKDLVRYPALIVDIPYSDSGYFWMDGPKVYKNISQTLPDLIKNAIKSAKVETKQIRMIIPHQASKPMVDAIAARLSPNMEVYFDLKEGNWSSASIPKAMKRAVKESAIGPGDKIVLVGFGAGLFASVVVAELG